jgi:hypothetical protein
MQSPFLSSPPTAFSNNQGTSSSTNRSTSGQYFDPLQTQSRNQQLPYLQGQQQQSAPGPMSGYINQQASGFNPITAPSEVWTPQQIQERVNSYRAMPIKQAQGQIANLGRPGMGKGPYYGGMPVGNNAFSEQAQNAMQRAFASGESDAMQFGLSAAQQNAQQALNRSALDTNRSAQIGQLAQGQRDQDRQYSSILSQIIAGYNNPLSRAESFAESTSRQSGRSQQQNVTPVVDYRFARPLG